MLGDIYPESTYVGYSGSGAGPVVLGIELESVPTFDAVELAKVMQILSRVIKRNRNI